jgi:hypothetical protein
MTTYYVRPTNGSDAAAGTTFGTAFQTTQKAADTATAGDVVRLCPEATETTAVSIDFDTNAGTNINPIIFEPGNVTDGGRDMSLTYTIQASASITGLFDFTGTADWVKFFNLSLDGNSNAASPVYNNLDTADGITFINCEIKNGTGDGVNVRGSSTGAAWFFLQCDIHSNGADGIGHSAGNRGDIHIFNSKIRDNTGDGWEVDKTECICVSCEIFGNGGAGLRLGSNSTSLTVHGCTIYNNTGDGIIFYNATSRNKFLVVNNTVSGNGGYGFNFNTTGDTDIAWVMDYNHTYNNTSGASDLTVPGDNNQTGDPLFEDTGADDFSPGTGSPLLSNGANGTTIGAAEPTLGGGGLIIHPGMNGGING